MILNNTIKNFNYYIIVWKLSYVINKIDDINYFENKKNILCVLNKHSLTISY